MIKVSKLNTKMSNESKVKLSLDKFNGLLEKHGYILSAVYCEKESVRFAECRTPRLQKTFIVYLPDKYTMTMTEGTEDLKRLDISSSVSLPSSRQIKFITDMKGHLLECDLVAVSSENVCVYRNSGKALCFDMTEEGEKENVEEEELEEEDNDIKSIEKDTERVLKKVDGPDAVLKTAKPKTNPEKKVSKTPDEKIIEDEGIFEEEDFLEDDLDKEITEKDEEKIELVFEDEDGEPFDEVKATINQFGADDAEESLKIIQEKFDEDEEEVDTYTEDNALPPEIEDGEIVLGIVYVMIDIGSFFKKISNYENEVVKFYEQLNENERDMRSRRLDSIKALVEKFLEHSQDRLKEISKEEDEHHGQLIRLTIVLAQASSLRKRVSENPSKYGEVVDETERIYQKTRKTIYDLNMELLKLRESADELLSNYHSSIKELIEI